MVEAIDLNKFTLLKNVKMERAISNQESKIRITYLEKFISHILSIALFLCSYGQIGILKANENSNSVINVNYLSNLKEYESRGIINSEKSGDVPIANLFDDLIDSTLFYLYIQQNYTICLNDSVQMLPKVFGPIDVISRLQYFWLHDGDTISLQQNPFLKSIQDTTYYKLIVKDSLTSRDESVVIALNTFPVPNAKIHIESNIICQNQKGLVLKLISNERFAKIDWIINPEDAGIYTPSQDPILTRIDLVNNYLQVTFKSVVTTFNECQHNIPSNVTIEARPNHTENYVRRKAESNLLFCKSINNAFYFWGYSMKENDIVIYTTSATTRNYNLYNSIDTNQYKYWVKVREGVCSDTYLYKNEQLNDVTINNIFLNPNPFNNSISVNINCLFDHKIHLRIFNIYNSLIYEDYLICNNYFEIQTSMWPSGLYIFELMDPKNLNNKFVKKILKE